MKFLYALEIDQGYLAHTPTGMRVPPKKFLSWKLKIWPKIQRVRLNNFWASGNILTGLFSADVPRGRGDKMGTIFTMPTLKNSWRPKNRPKFFTQLPTLITNISGKDQHIKNQKSSSSSTTPPTLGEKNLLYFGPQTKKLLTLINVHPNGLCFGRLYLGRYGVVRHEIFIHARDWPRLPSAHPTGTGGPKKLIVKIKNLA